jgi:hypothetical protein
MTKLRGLEVDVERQRLIRLKHGRQNRHAADLERSADGGNIVHRTGQSAAVSDDENDRSDLTLIRVGRVHRGIGKSDVSIRQDGRLVAPWQGIAESEVGVLYLCQ